MCRTTQSEIVRVGVWGMFGTDLAPRSEAALDTRGFHLKARAPTTVFRGLPRPGIAIGESPTVLVPGRQRGPAGQVSGRQGREYWKGFRVQRQGDDRNRRRDLNRSRKTVQPQQRTEVGRSVRVR